MPSPNESPAMKVAIAICEEFAEQWEQQARGGDSSGASDHRADAARQIIAELRNVNAAPASVVLGDERALTLLDSIITDMEGGFVRCENCGEQEDTATLDFMAPMRALRALLAAAQPASGEKA